MAEEQKQDKESQPQVVDAMHHVGPTLESEEEQVYVPRRETIPDERRAAAAAEGGMHVHTISREPGEERLTEHEESGSEPLKTRLPGDTSSDPHTDIDQNVDQK